MRRLSRPRLFLCDDNAGYRALSRIVLQESHEVVGEARDGREAIELAPAAAPDILLLDLNMPRLGGMAALPRLRALLPEAKIVILTTGRSPDERREALHAGADGFIVKPESVFALPDELGRILEDG
jgi:two-component system, chemotaxis family, chemotaxis protein CheY